MNKTKKIALYGIGNFGYAILKHLDKCVDSNVSIHAYDRNKEIIDFLKKERKHLRFHKSVKISKRINFESNIKNLINNCDILVLSVTSDATNEVLNQIKGHINKRIIIVNTAKALDYKSGERLSEIVNKKLSTINYDYALLAGGTIAKDLFKHEPLGINIACKNKKVLKDLVILFQSDNLFVYPTTDLTGVEYASSFKNVVSILAGITNGLGFSYGAETHIISRFANEIEELVIRELGGRKSTFKINSQCWGNDLWMSCTGNTRNREFGTLIGKGSSFEKALIEMKSKNKSVEGINTIKILNQIKNLENYYILNLLYQFSLENISLEEFRNLIFNNRNL